MSSNQQHFGLVCQTSSEECRFRAITRSRYLQLPRRQRLEALRAIYWDNLARLNWTIGFCARRGIHLYRMPSSLFPMSDEAVGDSLLDEMRANLSAIGRRVQRLKIRVVIHPDQFVVLNSENPTVVETSKLILAKHAKWLDLMGLPRTPWSAIILHGGKAGRASELVKTIATLPPSVRDRMCLENDEYAYSAAEIYAICKAARVPMIFDNLHHAIKEKLTDYASPEFAHWTNKARQTWPRADWQIVHLSNGAANFCDRGHSEFITDIPDAYKRVKWIEVEAKGKERAIAALRGGTYTAPQ